MSGFNLSDWQSSGNQNTNLGADFLKSYNAAHDQTVQAQQQQALLLARPKIAAAMQQGDYKTAAALAAQIGASPDEILKYSADAPTKAAALDDVNAADVAPFAANFLRLPDAASRSAYVAANRDILTKHGVVPQVLDALQANPMDPALNQTVQAYADHGYTQEKRDDNAVAVQNANSTQQNANTEQFKAYHPTIQRGSTQLTLDAAGNPTATYRAPDATDTMTDPGINDPRTAGGVVSSSAPATSAAPASGAAQTPEQIIARSMNFEGRQGNSYNPSDANGSPTNWGINWKANQKTLQSMGFTPQTFPNMTSDQAAQVYKANYWDQSGAAKLPANLQGPFFDVYIRSPNRAKAWLQASGGDPAKFMQLASAGFQRMAQTNPSEAPYAKAWANRDASNSTVAGGSGASAPAATDGGSTVYAGGFVAKPKPDNKAAWSSDGQGNLISTTGERKVDPTAGITDADTLQQAAADYRKNGKMPSIGQGSARARQQILAADAANVHKAGLTPQQAAVIPGFVKADQLALNKNGQWLQQLQGSFGTAQAHGQTMLDAWQKVAGQSNVTGFNRVVQGAEHFFSNPDLVAAQNATQNYNTEITHILRAGPSGNVAIPHEAYVQMQNINDPSLGYQAKLAAKNILDRMAQQKLDQVQHTTDVIQSRMSGPIDTYAAIARAHEAVRRGANPAAVRQRLEQAGILNVDL